MESLTSVNFHPSAPRLAVSIRLCEPLRRLFAEAREEVLRSLTGEESAAQADVERSPVWVPDFEPWIC
jgi:hypothetical protein